jgi:hypothetical protein
MKIFRMIRSRIFLLCAMIGFLLACSEPATSFSDVELQASVSAAIANAGDLPGDSLQITVRDGVVTVSGSLECEACGGNRLPGGEGSIQLSLGAVVRAVPGVQQVKFVFP